MLWLERPPQFESDEQAHDFLELYALRVERPTNEHITNYMMMVSLYRMKLAEVIWFDGDLNEDIDVGVWFNPAVANEQVASLVDPYVGFSRSYLQALCKNVREPVWVTEQEPPFENGAVKSYG